MSGRGRELPARTLPATRLAAGLAAFTLLAAAPAAAQDDYVFAVTTDYSTSGSSASIGIDAPWTVATGLEPVSSDPVVRFHDGLLYVVNRFLADNIQVIDPGDGFATIGEFSVGAGSNPQDIVLVSPTKAYVSRYESTQLYIVNPSAGTVTDSIDLAPYADPDGIPEMSRMALEGGRLFVQIQRFERPLWTPLAPSYLGVIDTAEDAIVDVDPLASGVQGIALTGTNPNGQMTVDPDTRSIYVAELGEYGVLDGGIERVDAAALVATGFVTSESQLAGDVGAFALSASRGYAVVSSDFFYTNDLASFSLLTGAREATLYTTDGLVSDLEYDAPSSQLFMADRSTGAPGVQVFSSATGAHLAGPLSTGLPPVDLALVRATTTTVVQGWSGMRAVARPNPLRRETEITLRAGASGAGDGDPGTLAARIAEAGGVRVDVHDVAGRLVRTLGESGAAEEGAAGGGLLSGEVAGLRWNGRDDAGRRVPAGVYFLRVTLADGSAGPGGGTLATGRVVVAR